LIERLSGVDGAASAEVKLKKSSSAARRVAFMEIKNRLAFF
jgi:hypothetical protein